MPPSLAASNNTTVGLGYLKLRAVSAKVVPTTGCRTYGVSYSRGVKPWWCFWGLLMKVHFKPSARQTQTQADIYGRATLAARYPRVRAAQDSGKPATESSGQTSENSS